jgi:dihydrofolate reductase
VKIILIAAISLDGFIAANKNDTLTWTKDKGLFKKQTLGHYVAMGKKTLSLIGSNLSNRNLVPVDSQTKTEDIFNKIQAETLFVGGGAVTNQLFIDHITHLYLTPHPIIFSSGVRLFGDKSFTRKTKLEKVISVEGCSNLNQFQFQVISH